MKLSNKKIQLIIVILFIRFVSFSQGVNLTPVYWDYNNSLYASSPSSNRHADIAIVPIGGVLIWTSTVTPTGWLVCDGSAVSRTTYSDLYLIIGTKFGSGNGLTTFNIPDLRQRFPIGVSVSGTGSTFAGTGGNIDHTHQVDPPITTTSAPAGTSGQLVGVINVASSLHTHTVDITPFNSAYANPPYIALYFIIKT